MHNDFIYSKWNKSLYNEYIEYLISIGDKKLSSFNKKIINTKQEIIGIKIPVLRDIAKKISKGNVDSFLNLVGDTYFEEILVSGFVIGSIKDKDIFLEYFNSFVKNVDNWATCDMCVSSFKIMKKIDFFDFAKTLAFNDFEFISRVGIVIMLDHYVDSNHIEDIIKVVKSIKSSDYYVNMALSWLVSVLFIKFRVITLDLLKQRILPVFVQNKAIQKIRDSYRVSKEDKDMLLLYKYN